MAEESKSLLIRINLKIRSGLSFSVICIAPLNTVQAAVTDKWDLETREEVLGLEPKLSNRWFGNAWAMSHYIFIVGMDS